MAPIISSSGRQEDTVLKKEELYSAVMQQDWERVAEIYNRHPEIHAAMITKSKDTALHVAISHSAPEDKVQNLIGEIAKTDTAIAMGTLAAENNHKDTPLHLAASRGSQAICKRIELLDESLKDYAIANGIDYEPLIYKRNVDGETPLFLAALNGHKYAFHYLHPVCAQATSELWRRKNGDTILHCTIQREYFDLSFEIIHLYKDKNIASSVNEEGSTPLRTLATNPSAFKSGTHLTWWQRLCYEYIRVEKLKIDAPVIESSHDINIDNSRISYAPAKSHQTRGSIRKMKEKHAWVDQIVGELVNQNSEYEFDENESAPFEDLDLSDEETLLKVVDEYKKSKGDEDEQNQQQGKRTKDKKSTALLIATKLGLMDLVEKILAQYPVAIHDKTPTKNRNIVLEAVRNRQPHILKFLKKHRLWLSLREAVDVDRNNALHLAANLPEHLPWDIHGSALQMQWEVKWFEYVKEIMPPYLSSQVNEEGDTSEEIFARKHKELIKAGNDWLKDTTGSYSIVAALTAGVTYATSYTVPGGNDQSTGKPLLRGQPAFNIFAVSSLLSFCFSITSLAAFLAVYSSRMQAKDFRMSLPLKLCLGLSSFFISVVAMLVSFCAAHSFELDHREQHRISPWYSLTLIPLGLYAAAQIPLYWDLLRASFTKVPKPKHVGQDIPI